MYRLLSGAYLGWGLGANDAANIFGTGVASGVVKYRTAIILTAVFVIIGAYVEGARGIETYGKLSGMDINSAFIATLAAAVTINILTVLSLPVSTSQAIVGSIIAIGLVSGSLNVLILRKIFLSWVLSPLGAAVISYILYRSLGRIIENRIRNVRVWSLIMKIGFYTAGIYGSYTLGANNVANTTGVFVKAGMVSLPAALLIGGGSIGLGVLTYSKGVMNTVGSGITHLSEFGALTAILSMDLTVHIFTWVGVPVSTSQAIVGSVVGVGLVKSSKAINKRIIGRIGLGWLSTPIISLGLAYMIYTLYSLFF
ncbi:MAG: anion permease [Spirochaetota bacterium]|nr:MAG: anion permease [Spirochaetota bacterium]